MDTLATLILAEQHAAELRRLAQRTPAPHRPRRARRPRRSEPGAAPVALPPSHRSTRD